jgi:hypothetical protein
MKKKESAWYGMRHALVALALLLPCVGCQLHQRQTEEASMTEQKMCADAAAHFTDAHPLSKTEPGQIHGHAHAHKCYVYIMGRYGDEHGTHFSIEVWDVFENLMVADGSSGSDACFVKKAESVNCSQFPKRVKQEYGIEVFW